MLEYRMEKYDVGDNESGNSIYVTRKPSIIEIRPENIFWEESNCGGKKFIGAAMAIRGCGKIDTEVYAILFLCVS